MPNVKNITRPITLIAYGRSGTTLLWNIFNNHPQVFAMGESVDLIHSVWHAIRFKLPWCNIQSYPNSEKGYDQLCAETIQDLFVKHFYSSQRFWFHKPISLPISSFLIKDTPEFVTQYWDVLSKVFPESINISIFRNPLDVVVSSHKFGGWPYGSIVEHMIRMAEVILSNKAEIKKAIGFEQLLRDPESQVRQLVETTGIPFKPKMLTAFDKLHAPNIGTKEEELNLLKKNRERAGFSHKAEWKQILELERIDTLIEKYKQMFRKFDLDWEYPF